MKKVFGSAFLVLVACASSSDRVDDELPISLACAPPAVEELHYEGQAVGVSRKHCIDKMGPDADGYYPFYYDYELYEFSSGTLTLLAKTYADEDDAQLLAIRSDGQARLLAAGELSEVLPRAAVHYFRSRGRARVTWLDRSNDLDGYSPIP